MKYRVCALLMTAFFTLSACSGGGGGSNESNEPQAPQVGGLTVTLGDAAIDGFDRAVITVEEITLLGSGGQSVFAVGSDDEPVVVDLLQLRNVTEMVFDGDVAAGTYNKIRLQVSDLQLQVEVDGEVDPSQTVRPDLPAGGKLDLNPQGPFEISPGEDVVVQIDVDLDRSVHIVTTGNGRYKFRPVVFVDVVDAEQGDRLVRLHGRMENKTDDGPALDLCEIQRLSDEQDEPMEDCLDTHLSDALLIGEDGQPTDFPSLIAGEMATTFGWFKYGLEAGDEYFDALVLAVGEADNFEQVHGTVSVAFDGTSFALSEDEDEDDAPEADAAAPSVVVEPVDGAVVLDDDGMPTTTDALTLAAEVEALGRFSTDGDVETFHAFLLYVEQESEESEEVEGELVEIAAETQQLTLADDEGMQVCVSYSEETTVLVVVESDEAAEFVEGDLEDLELGVEVEARGVADGDCFVADELIVEMAASE